MKILRIEPSEFNSKAFTLQLNFDKASGVLSGTVGTYSLAEGDVILNINLDLNKWVGQLVECRIVTTDQGHEPIYFNPLKNYSIANGMPAAPGDRHTLRVRVFRLYVQENIDDSIIQVMRGHEEIEGFENIVEDGDLELTMYNLIRRDAQAAHLLKLARLKSAMLGEVDQRDSVSYLEAQVDIITRILLEMHPNSSLLDLLQEADNHSVLNIKNATALSKEFSNKKAWVRTVQKDYYDAKAKLEAEQQQTITN